MSRSAEPPDALLFTPSRNGKLRLSRELVATALDPERGWPLTAPTGEAARHRSGLEMRSPRVPRIGWEKLAHEADRLTTLEGPIAPLLAI